MEGRLAIISDIHGNLEALLSVLSRIPPGLELICLGDVVGYGPDPNACLDLLRGRHAVIVKGNHDSAVSDDERLVWFNPLAREAMLWTRSVLTAENLQFLQQLPETYQIGRTLFVHGTPQGPVMDYIDRGTADSVLTRSDIDFSFVGHTHEMVVYARGFTKAFVTDASLSLDAPAVINVGSVGQPRDGNPKASLCFWAAAGRELQCLRLNYDIAATQRKMQQAGLPRPIITRLSRGQ